MKKKVKDNRTHHVTFRMNEEEHIRFLNMLNRTRAKSRSQFIIDRIFGTPFKVYTSDRETLRYCTDISVILNQVRKIGHNYNQVTKAIHNAYEEKRAYQLLGKLALKTHELTVLLSAIRELTEELHQRNRI